MTKLTGLDTFAGYRLAKLELYNWGTFDGAVHGFCPRGDWALLVGENGTGKSTIVDALLTLLVRPNTRKYNFASGAAKTERDERTYIQGAYDKTVGPTGTPQLRYLRPGSKHYSALLACFENQQSGKSFTVCQILYLDSNNKPRKFYAFDDRRARGIAEDLGKITENSSVLATLKSRDFKATESYAQYFEWLRRSVRCLPKAMDMFNQAAWVKDVQQLDSFVREQMLEKKPWDAKVSQLLKHFAELSEAHRALVVVRDQAKMLGPIVQNARLYHEVEQKRDHAKQQLNATSLYFSFASERLLRPLCQLWQDKIESLDAQIDGLEEQIDGAKSEVARLELEIRGAGGQRMARLPDLIALEQERAEIKRTERLRFEALLGQAGIDATVDAADALVALQATVRSTMKATIDERATTQQAAASLQYEIGQLRQRLVDDRDELASLETRKGNMPRELVFLRDEICRELKIATRDLPFAAELMAILPDYREWEASVEQVLSGFARDLLVKDRHYAKVSGYIDRQRLVDREGRGQRLSYTRVIAAPTSSLPDRQRHETSLLSMLKFREENELAPWVRSQVASRFDFLACESIEQFQIAEQAAMTRNRHIKRSRVQHSKDDRTGRGDRRQFVLGWENREKILALKLAIEDGRRDLEQLETREARQTEAIAAATRRIGHFEQINAVTDFDAIDDARHRRQAAEYQLELDRLKQSNDKIRELEGQKKELEEAILRRREQSRTLSEQRSQTKVQWDNGRRLCDAAAQAVEQAKREGAYEQLAREFDGIEAMLADEPLSLENLASLPGRFKDQRHADVARLSEQLESLARPLRSRMGRFLAEYPQFRSDMDGDVDSLPQFIALHERIEKDDLPRHEKRFKERLNEKVLHEVGVLNSHLENEREEIIGKIEEINAGLRRMEWDPVRKTHVRLEPEDCKDPEIRDFRRELAGCLTGYLEGTTQASEETFLRIQKLVDKLRDDNNLRWREKVIDVRRWFNFSAREILTATGEGGSYYDGGSGKSGGEKAKLAFLVLVAAIVYQYDIDPDDPRSDRFHLVMVDEMFSRTASKFAKYALDLFKQFGLQLLIVAPLDAKARVCEPHVGLHAHVVKDPETHRSEILSYESQPGAATPDAQPARVSQSSLPG